MKTRNESPLSLGRVFQCPMALEGVIWLSSAQFSALCCKTALRNWPKPHTFRRHPLVRAHHRAPSYDPSNCYLRSVSQRPAVPHRYQPFNQSSLLAVAEPSKRPSGWLLHIIGMRRPSPLRWLKDRPICDLAQRV